MENKDALEVMQKAWRDSSASERPRSSHSRLCLLELGTPRPPVHALGKGMRQNRECFCMQEKTSWPAENTLRVWVLVACW